MWPSHADMGPLVKWVNPFTAQYDYRRLPSILLVDDDFKLKKTPVSMVYTKTIQIQSH